MGGYDNTPCIVVILSQTEIVPIVKKWSEMLYKVKVVVEGSADLLNGGR